MITEVEELNLPHVVTGDLYSTKVVCTYSVVVLTKPQWQALSNRELYMLVGIVQGSGGIIRGIDITKPLSAEVTLLSLKRQPIALTGVQGIVISSNTSLGIGRLKFEYSTRKLYWKAPGDSDFGLGMEIGISGVYKIWDNLSVTYIKVDIDYSRLPLSAMEEDVEIINILEQTELIVGTMRDTLHRGLLGTGMPSLRNPHGLTLDDLDPGELQDINKHLLNAHSPGILGSPGSISGVVSVYSTTQIRINSIVPGEMILTGGKTILQLADTFKTVSGSSGTYYVWVGEGGRVEVDSTAPDLWYLVLATVSWNGASIVSVTDKRVWGSISPSIQVQMDDKSYILDPSTTGYTIADSLAMIRWIIKRLIGESTWLIEPADTINNIVVSWLPAIEADIVAAQVAIVTLESHVAKRLQDATIIDKLHGVYLGQGGGINADKLCGMEPNTVASHGNIVVATRNDTWKIDPSFIDLTNMPNYTITNTPFYSWLINVQASGGDVHDQVGWALKVVLSGVTVYIPYHTVECGCTITCGCTGTCGCTCTGTCGCTGTGGGGGGCNFFG